MPVQPPGYIPPVPPSLPDPSIADKQTLISYINQAESLLNQFNSGSITNDDLISKLQDLTKNIGALVAHVSTYAPKIYEDGGSVATYIGGYATSLTTAALLVKHSENPPSGISPEDFKPQISGSIQQYITDSLTLFSLPWSLI